LPKILNVKELSIFGKVEYLGKKQGLAREDTLSTPKILNTASALGGSDCWTLMALDLSRSGISNAGKSAVKKRIIPSMFF
jgi:hypothetical protein